VITRRNIMLGAGATLVCAPAVVRAAGLMKVRGIVMPVQGFVTQRNYYGFVDRLWRHCLYQQEKLRGRALINAIENGVFNGTPPDELARYVRKWGGVGDAIADTLVAGRPR
jgi:hypothetical protein